MKQTTKRQHIEATIRRYFDGCNKADVATMTDCFSPEAVHYFPAGAPQGTFVGAQAIAAGWVEAVRTLGSIWTIDQIAIDDERSEAVIEWTHFKPNLGVHLRGAEWYCFDDAGRITEIRAYYAAPTTGVGNHDLGDFDYEGRGYAIAAPDVGPR